MLGQNEKVADGVECVMCGNDLANRLAGEPVASVPVGRDVETGSQVFACARCCGEGDE